MGINRDSKIYVAGHTGMVGSAIVRRLKMEGYNNLILKKRVDLDLTNQLAVRTFYKQNKPEYVFLGAAKVGGIHANNIYRAQFIYENLQIQNNLIHFANLYGVKKLLFLGSSCIYPRESKQPIKEEYLLAGPLELTNEPYAVAKISGIKMCESYTRQYGSNFISVMPTNLYGPNDNYDLKNSHVIPALIKKFIEAKRSNQNNVTVWGTGNARREFLHSDDLADGLLFIMERLNAEDLIKENISHINIGTGYDITIKELAELIKDISGFGGKILYDHSKPNGTPRKCLDCTRINNLGWKSTIKLEDGLRQIASEYN